MATIPLEDAYNDVVGKAQRGLKLSDAELTARAGVSQSVLDAVKNGENADPAVLEKLAGALGLGARSLVTMAEHGWQPLPVELQGLAQFNTVYDDMTVNAYLVWDPVTRRAAAFDTGADASPLLEFAAAKGLTLERVFLTHTHVDHVADLAKLRALDAGGAQAGTASRVGPAATGAALLPLHACIAEPWDGAELFACGQVFTIGNLKVETRQTRGHSKGGVTYVIHGLSRPVAVVGDALFCSSMGGGGVSYADALATNRKEIFTLPDDTVLCPGHGPLTSVGEEKLHNPFYPEFKNGQAG